MSPAINSPQPDATELWRLREIEAAKLCDASTGGCDRLLRQLSWLEAHYCQAIKTCCGAALHVPHVRLSARFILEAVHQVAMSCIRALVCTIYWFCCCSVEDAQVSEQVIAQQYVVPLVVMHPQACNPTAFVQSAQVDRTSWVATTVLLVCCSDCIICFACFAKGLLTFKAEGM